MNYSCIHLLARIYMLWDVSGSRNDAESCLTVRLPLWLLKDLCFQKDGANDTKRDIFSIIYMS